MKECSMKGIYLLEVPDDTPVDDDTSDTNDPRISISALTGISSSMTMHLDISVADNRALVDSGSTHCFITADTTRRAGLVPLPRPGLTVDVANGDRVTCEGVCPAVPITIGDEHFAVDIFIIALGGFELVLGCQWVRTLGPILWDFEHQSMSFSRSDHCVQWFGLDTGSIPRVATLAADNLMQLLLAEFVGIFTVPQGLPPTHALDHRIHLLPDTPPGRCASVSLSAAPQG
jgi:hypothetical protein